MEIINGIADGDLAVDFLEHKGDLEVRGNLTAGVECAEANLKTHGFIKANKINSTVKHGYVVS